MSESNTFNRPNCPMASYLKSVLAFTLTIYWDTDDRRL